MVLGLLMLQIYEYICIRANKSLIIFKQSFLFLVLTVFLFHDNSYTMRVEKRSFLVAKA